MDSVNAKAVTNSVAPAASDLTVLARDDNERAALERAALERAVAHRPRALATLYVESRDRRSRLSALPRLGPLQMIERYTHSPRLFVVGGVDAEGDLASSLCSFSLHVPREWTSIPLDQPLAYVSAAALKSERLCFAGGLDVAYEPVSVAFAVDERHSPVQLSPLPSMAVRRWAHGVLAVSDSLFAVGGFDASGVALVDASDNALSSAEVLVDGAAAWRSLPPMPTARGGFTACALGDALHVAGGSNHNGGAPLRSHERFDIHSAQWHALAALPDDCPWTWSAGAPLAGGFIVCGGIRLGPSTHVSLYDVRTNAWRSLSPMITPRCGFECVVLDDRVFALGGVHSSNMRDYTASVEAYDAAAERWSAAWFSLPEPHIAFGAAFVE